METEKREQEPGQLGAEIEKEIKAQSVSEKDSNFTIETKIKREQLKKEYESADAARRRQIAEELKKLESELSLEARAERLKGLKIEVTGFTKAIKEAAEDPNKRENVPWLDDEEMAVYLKKCIPGIFHEFFEKHCKFIYDPTVENDTVMPKAKGEKINFTIGKKTLFETVKYGDKAYQVIKPLKLKYQIGRMLGCLLREPTNWDKFAKKIQVEKDKKVTDWEDFVGLWLTDRKTAEELCPQAVEELNDFMSRVSSGEIDLKDQKTEQKSFEEPKDLDPGQIKEGRLAKILKFLPRVILHARNETRGLIRSIFEEKLIWYDMALSEMELEEAKLITIRQEHISDRDRRLWAYITTGDKFGSRGLLLADASTSDSRWWRYELYLSYFDPSFQSTGGEYITKESYDFLVRCTRTSHSMKRSGTKPGKYVVGFEHGQKVYKRKLEGTNDGNYQGDACGEIEKLSSRNVLNTAEECFDWMRCEGRVMELDEYFGGERPWAFRMGLIKDHNWEDEKYSYETGNMHEARVHLPEWLTKRAFEHPNKKCAKLDGDQLAVMARLIAALELAESGGMIGGEGGKPGYVRDPFKNAEHARTIQKELAAFYTQRVKQYKAWSKDSNQTIETYEAFIRMINNFKKGELAGIKAEGLTPKDHKTIADIGLEIDETPARETNEIIKDEPNVRLHRDPHETAARYKTVNDIKEQYEANFRLDIEKESDVPKEVKEWLYQNPSRLLDFLTDVDIVSKEVAREILEEKGVAFSPDNPEFAELAERIERQSALTLKEYFQKNQTRLLTLMEAHDWVENGDLKPFIASYDETRKAYINLRSKEAAKHMGRHQKIIDSMRRNLDEGHPEKVLAVYARIFPKKPQPQTPEEIITITKKLIGEAEKKASDRRTLLAAEQRNIQKALGIFEGKIIVSPTGQIQVSELSPKEREDLEAQIDTIGFPVDIDPASEAGRELIERVSFLRDLEDEVAKKYFCLKAIEATLAIEIDKLPKEKESKEPEVREEEFVPEFEEDND